MHKYELSPYIGRHDIKKTKSFLKSIAKIKLYDIEIQPGGSSMFFSTGIQFFFLNHRIFQNEQHLHLNVSVCKYIF